MFREVWDSLGVPGFNDLDKQLFIRLLKMTGFITGRCLLVRVLGPVVFLSEEGKEVLCIVRMHSPWRVEP